MPAPALKARLALSDELNSFDVLSGRQAIQLWQAASWKLTTALPVDGLGDLKPPVVPALLITTDTVPNDASGSNPTLTVTPVGGAITDNDIIGTIDTIGDQDYYEVTLTAGVAYEIGLYSYTGGPNAAGLTDPYLELYASDGTTLVVSADGGADTVYNQVNSGFDVLLVYTPTVTGTYYVNARAFSNSPATTDGDSVGDYQLFAREQDPNDPNVYHPYYAPTEPLYAIDWGTMVDKVNVTARNPDGNEGTRTNAGDGVDPTGNAQGTPVFSNLLDIPALAAAQGKDITGKNVITIYFAQAGDVFVSNDPTNPGLPPATITAVGVQDFEYNAVWTALHEFEKVADVVYLEVDDRDLADFVYTSYQGTPGPGISLLGSMSPPGESDEGLAQFNSGDERWNERDLAQGGFSFVTLIHEFGHGHGLAHPHDNGGHSGIMNGVEEEPLVPGAPGVADYTTGDYELNQGVFTMMSYEDGWQSSPYGNADTDVGFGYLGGLMAFDIAAIQDKYGVNEDWATGDNTYVMPDENVPGTFFYSIWDAGGTDEIVYYGAANATIDLRQATLKYEVGGGGRVSYAYGIYGGFTIANGVTIENASGGSGNDLLIGNLAANALSGGAGNDVLYFGAYLTGADRADGGDGRDAVVLQGNYTITFDAANFANLEAISLQSGSVTKWGDLAGNSYDYDITTADANVATGVQMLVNAQSLLAGEDFIFDGSGEIDGKFLVYAGHGTDDLTGGAGNDVFHFEGARFGAGDTVHGGGGSDAVVISMGSGVNYVAFGETQFTEIESISVNNKFASDPSQIPSYKLVMADGNVAAGATLIVNGQSLAAGQTISVDGSAETDGRYRMFGGAGDDVFIGGANDDQLMGLGGADTFTYLSAADSKVALPDQILEFEVGTDTIDLAGVDANDFVAGNSAFAFIGSSAFHLGNVGELRAEYDAGSSVWRIEGETNGDGVADFLIYVTATTADPLTAGDFVL